MSRFFDDKVLSDAQICEEACENGQVSPESRYNDYRNRLPFHYIEDGENDGYYYWTYGATMELSIVLSDDVAWGEDQPVNGIEVDDELSETSENPVQNKVITKVLNGKLDKSVEKTILDQAYIKTAAGDNSRLNISIEQLPFTLVERDTHGHVMTSKADSEGQAVAYEQLEQRVPAGGKAGQNLAKKSDTDYDTYWADPDDINSIEHITLNGEEVPIKDKTAHIKVDVKTIGLESTNVAYTDKENTFTKPQTLSYRDPDDNSVEYAEIGGSSAHYNYTQYTDDTHKESLSREAYISAYTGRINIDQTIYNESGRHKNSLTLDVRNNWIACTEIDATSTGSITSNYYVYKLPKTHPNIYTTLATIEDLTAQLGALNIENGTGNKSLQQVINSDFTLVNINSDTTGQTIQSGAVGEFAVAFGGKSRAEGKRAFTAGTQTIASGNYSAAFGNNSISEGTNSFVSGLQNIAKGNVAYCEGANNLSSGDSSHTEGVGNKAYGNGSHIEGYQNIENETGNENNHLEGSNNTTYAGAINVHIEGANNKAGKAFSHAEGRYTDANGNYSHTEGIYSKSMNTIPVDGGTGGGEGSGTGGTFDLDANAGSCIHAEGDSTIAIGYGSHAEGYSTQTEGHFSHTEGVRTKTKGFTSYGAHVEGYENTAAGTGAHVGGRSNTLTDGEASIVHGYNNSVTGAYNSIFGSGVIVNGINVTALGPNHNILGDNIHALGNHLVKVGNKTGHGQVVLGRFNKNETTYDTSDGVAPVLIVGAGLSGREYNALVIDSNGQVRATQHPTTDTSVVRKLELDTKYDKTGGTISGSVVITGDLTVNGTQHINNTENLNVENAMIYSNAKGATLATNGGIGIKKNATDVYGIVYDPTSDSVKLGLGKSDANGKFTFNANEGQPVAIRDDSTKFNDNHLVKWDADNNKLVDSGYLADDFVDLSTQQSIAGMKTFKDEVHFGTTHFSKDLNVDNAAVKVFDNQKDLVTQYKADSIVIDNGTGSSAVQYVLTLPKKTGTLLVTDDLNNYVASQSESADAYYAQITNENGIISARIFKNDEDDVQNLIISKDGVTILGKNVANTEQLDNKVDKLSASLRNQAYVRNANGEDTGLAYTYTDEGGTLAVRNASGQLQVSDPSQDKDAANKSYADNLNARYVSTSILGG